MQQILELKSWSYLFKSIKQGYKTHDLRKKDRHYYVGQRLKLCEYDQVTGTYTGDFVIVEVTYITDNVHPCAVSSAALDNNFAILSISLINVL